LIGIVHNPQNNSILTPSHGPDADNILARVGSMWEYTGRFNPPSPCIPPFCLDNL